MNINKRKLGIQKIILKNVTQNLKFKFEIDFLWMVVEFRTKRRCKMC